MYSTSGNQSRIFRALWLVMGILALVLAALGVILPVLPTTPFVLIAAFAFSRSSPRLHAWLENNPTFGPVIVNWRETGSIAPKVKMLAVGMMLAVFVLSLVMGVKLLILVIQAVCMGGAAAFILTRPNH